MKRHSLNLVCNGRNIPKRAVTARIGVVEPFNFLDNACLLDWMNARGVFCLPCAVIGTTAVSQASYLPTTIMPQLSIDNSAEWSMSRISARAFTSSASASAIPRAFLTAIVTKCPENTQYHLAVPCRKRPTTGAAWICSRYHIVTTEHY